MTKTDPGDYYARKRAEAREAIVELVTAQCKACHGKGGSYSMDRDEYRGCLKCDGTGCAPGFTSADLIRLERAYERACYVGD